MSPFEFLVSLLGAARVTLLLLIRHRHAAVSQVSQPEITDLDFPWRFGALCAALAFFWALIYAMALFGAGLPTISGLPLGVRLWRLSLSLLTGVGLTQKRRWGIVAFAIFCLTPNAGSHLDLGSLWYWSNVLSFCCTVIYFGRRWPSMPW
jgi:hypothetical protein